MKTVTAKNAPEPIGPYSQAVEVNGIIYTSGQLGLDPATGKLPEGIEAQTEAALKNIEAILRSTGLSLAHVFKSLVFIKDMDDFGQMNQIYNRFFTQDFPARSCVEAARLPKDALVEIEVMAHRR